MNKFNGVCLLGHQMSLWVKAQRVSQSQLANYSFLVPIENRRNELFLS